MEGARFSQARGAVMSGNDKRVLTPRMKRRVGRKTARGMTLVETVVGLLILGVCIAGMCLLMVSVKESGDLARDHYVAINLAKNRVERAKTFEFDMLPSFAEDGTVVDQNGAPAGGARYRRSTTVTAVSSNLVEFVVTVAIRDRETLAFDSENEIARTYVANMLMGLPEDQE
jgi:type II secretory pathway pseudopilin PulG